MRGEQAQTGDAAVPEGQEIILLGGAVASATIPLVGRPYSLVVIPPWGGDMSSEVLSRTRPESARKTPMTSVIIPALNEEPNLPWVLPRIPSWVDEVILVDGHSIDDTIQMARAVLPTIRVITQEGKGKGAALRAGVNAARGDIIVMLDADGSTDPAEIPAFVGALLAGADYAKGTRCVQGAGTSDMTLFRRIGNWALTTLANMVCGSHLTDITYGYNAVWRDRRHCLALDIDGWPCEIIGAIRAVRNSRVVEVPSIERCRIGGQTNLRAIRDGWTILVAMVHEFLREAGGRRRDERGLVSRVKRLDQGVAPPVWDVTPLLETGSAARATTPTRASDVSIGTGYGR